jgi:hypothetical protein
LLALGVWLNSGTLAPYGATLASPLVSEPCKYLLNIDHFHFKATFWMLDGAPREQWDYSVVLRRLLYPLVAFLPMKVLGFGGGGLVTNVLIAWASLVAFWGALRRRLGSRVPTAVLWLIATYPGWYYWAGTPYSYAAIVPASLCCMVLLWRVETLGGLRDAALVGLGLGVLFTAYDLLPFFGAAAVLLLATRRRWGAAAVLGTVQALPPVLVPLALERLLGVPFPTANSATYRTILASYLPPYDGATWASLLGDLPGIAVDVFFCSNFVFVPLLVVAAVVVSRRLPADGRALGSAEGCLLVAAVLLFLINNAAPPYAGWQLRGTWIARLYQPILPALVSIVAAVVARRDLLAPLQRRALAGALVLAIGLDAWVMVAPVLGHPGLTGLVYYRFYRHAPRPVYAENVRKYGARPVGFCTPPTSAASVTH